MKDKMGMPHQTDLLERKIYSVICSHDGLKAKEIGRLAGTDRKTVNQYLYKAPFMRELCCRCVPEACGLICLMSIWDFCRSRRKRRRLSDSMTG